MKLEHQSSLVVAAALAATVLYACVVSRGVDSSRGIDVGDPAGPTLTTGTGPQQTTTSETSPTEAEDAGADTGAPH
jgi:hypothetical protein